jgi:hypothetical protein
VDAEVVKGWVERNGGYEGIVLTPASTGLRPGRPFQAAPAPPARYFAIPPEALSP